MPRPSDVIVVGAGIVGSAIALELARRSASVEIIDDRGIGMGATQASAGILAPYIESRDSTALFDLTVRSLDLYDEFMAAVTSGSGLPVTYRRTGTLNVATDEEGLSELRTAARGLGRRGIAAELLDARAVRLQEPQLSDEAVGGLLIPAHGFVAAHELARATIAAARRHGVQVVEQNRVTRILPSGNQIVVETDRGRLEADAVVLAAGSWSSSIQVAGVTVALPVKPVRGQLLWLLWNGPRLRRVVWSSRCYLVPWEDGTVLVGATLEQAGFDERATVAGVRDLLDAACDIVPHAWKAGFGGARVGLRPCTDDELPIIGPSAVIPNLVYATGHYRNGVLLAPLTAQLVADVLMEGRIDSALASVSPARFGEL